jgi:hypothetical protein
MAKYIHSPIRLHGVVLNWLGTGTTLPYHTLSHDSDCSLLLLWNGLHTFMRHLYMTIGSILSIVYNFITGLCLKQLR